MTLPITIVRLVGILSGSALALAFLIVALGLPEVLPDSTGEAITPNASATTAQAPQSIVEASVPLDATDDPPPPAADKAAKETTRIEEQVASIFEPVAESQPEQADLAPQATAVQSDEVSQDNWYAFWSPFRSELAANGFVSQLQKTTGMDYRVVRLKPGVYEVAFAYIGDEDLATKLAAISTATGLEMPDG